MSFAKCTDQPFFSGVIYGYDHRFIGDFEVYDWESASRRKFGEQTRSDTHEVWIPIVRKGTMQ
jgi:predicted transcriptional regulator YdeE